MAAVTRTKLSVECLDSFGGRDGFPITVESGDGVGEGYPINIADGASNQTLAFPGITTLSTLWLTTDADITVTLGPTASNQGKTVKAGGVIGFAKGALPASTGVSVSYTPGDSSVAHLRVFASGS